MKIFANKFCLELRTDAPHAHFTVERSPLSEVEACVRRGEVQFPGQVFRVEAGQEVECGPRIFALHSAAAAAELPLHLMLLFADEAALQAFFDSYARRFKCMHAAGGLVVNAAEDLLLIRRYDRWDLPKGKVEKGESWETAACREVMEETGLPACTLRAHFADTWHIFPQKEVFILKCTHWYLMDTDAGTAPLRPQTEEDITDVAWMPVRSFRTEMPETWPLIQELLREISRIYPG